MKALPQRQNLVFFRCDPLFSCSDTTWFSYCHGIYGFNLASDSAVNMQAPQPMLRGDVTTGW